MLRHPSSLLAVFALLSFPVQSRATLSPEVRTGALPRGADSLQLLENGRNLAPLLKPEVFRRLSSAGQRAVLRAAGLLAKPVSARPPRSPDARTVRPLTPSAGQNVRVNDPSADVDGHTNSESSVAVLGGSVIVGFNDTNSFDASGYGLSADGGSAFRHESLPTDLGGPNLGDPVVAFGPNGEIYYSTLALASDGVSVISLCSSTDGAVSWTCTEASTIARSPLDRQDKDWLAVDTTSSKFRGNVYVAWTDFTAGSGDFILFARSTDGGRTFSFPSALSPIDGSVLVQNAYISVGPNGEVWVSYLDSHFGGSGITVTKSTDGGATFSTLKPAVLFTEIGSTLTGGNGVRADSFPVTAVDKDGTYHLVYASVTPGQTLDRSDITYVRSADGGVTFSAPVRLNDDATTTSQWSPAIAATADGRIAVKWWDRRNDPLNDSLTDVYMTVSTDGGATWGKNIRVTDHNWVFGPSELGSYHGDYDGLAADAGNFHLSWSDERGSDPDVYYATLPSAATAGPDFNVSAQPVYASVRVGESATYDLATSASNDFSGSLSLSASPSAPGLSYAFSSPSAAAGQPARLTVSVAAPVSPGTFLITIAARGPGFTRKTNVRLNVQPAARSASLPLDVSRSAGFTKLAGAPRIDSAGTIHLVYDDDTQNVTGEDVFYRRSTDRGLTWSTPLKVSTNTTAATTGVLALDSSGNPYVAYVAQNGATGEIWTTRSTDHGATFQPPLRVSNASRNADLPAIAVDANRNVVVAYIDQDPSNNLLVVNAVRSTDGGATFGPVQSLAGENNINPLQPLSLAFDSTGAAYLAWSTTGGGAGFTARMAIAPNGTTFTVKKTVSDTSVDAFAPRIAVDKSDALYVTFYNRYVNADATFNREIMLTKSTNGGSTFSPPVNVSNDGGQSFFPSVVPDSLGGVSIVWEDDTGNDQSDVFYVHSSDGGKAFGAPVNLSASPGVSTGAVGAVDALGNLLVLWTDDSFANPEVFAAWAPTGDSSLSVAIAPLPDGSTVDAGGTVQFLASVTQLDPSHPATVAWDFGDGTAGTGSPVDHAYAAPGTYVVTLIARDAVGLASTATLTVTVRAPAFTGGPEQLLPVVLDTPGAGGTHYTSELTLASKAANPVTVLLQYTASAGFGSGYASVTLAQGELRVIPDAIAFLRSRALAIPDDGSAQIGTLRVLFQGASSSSDVFVGARTSTPGGGGTFGLFYASSQTSTTSATVFGLQQNDAQRSNLALVNAGPDPVTLHVQLQGPNGADLGSLGDQALPGWGWTQINQPLLGQASSGRAVITRVSGASPFTAYGVLNDAVTSDGSFVPAEVPGDTTGADRLVPIVLSAAGYQSELTLTNFTNQPMLLTLVYTGSPQLSAAGTGTAPLTLQPGEQKILPDSMTFLRNLGLPIPTSGDVGGTLLVRTPAGTPASSLAVGARTYTNAVGGGTFGLFYPGLTPGESATASAYVYGLQQNGVQRSNLAVVNRGDASDAIAIRVTYHGTDGAALPNPDTAALAPGEWRQFNGPLGSRGAAGGYAKVERLSGNSRFVSYGVLNDQHNSDGSYIPMSR